MRTGRTDGTGGGEFQGLGFSLKFRQAESTIGEYTSVG